MRVAAYCRVSTDSADQSNSFAAQQQFFREYIAAQPGWELFEIYADEGISGTVAHSRPAFLQMLEDARTGAFSLILTKEVSRFSRNLLDTVRYTRELKGLGVAVFFITDGIHSNDADAELRLSIMASLAQEESRRTSQRVQWGQLRQMEMGVVFGPAPLGYRVKNGRLCPEPEEALTVRRIFEMYTMGGRSCREIATVLSDEGERSWSAGSIRKILHNEKYVGDLLQRKSYTPDYLSHKSCRNRGEVPMICHRDHHEPIISRELWEETQQRLTQGQKQGAAVSHRYAFSGKIRCGRCGAVFTARKKNGRRYWRCGCGIGCMLRDDDAAAMFYRALTCLETEPVRSSTEEAVLFPKLLERLESRERRMLMSYFNGEISPEECRTFRLQFERQRAQLQKMCGSCDAGTAELSELWEDEVGAELLIKNLLESITVFEDRHTELRFIGIPPVFHFQRS